MPKVFYWLGRHERLTAERWIKGGWLKGVYKFGVVLHTPHSLRMARSEDPLVRKEAVLAAWKIDIVVETRDEVWIIQVSDKPRDSAISRLLKYKFEYEKQYKPEKPVRLGLVAAVDDVAFHGYMRELGITWWIV